MKKAENDKSFPRYDDTQHIDSSAFGNKIPEMPGVTSYTDMYCVDELAAFDTVYYGEEENPPQ